MWQVLPTQVLSFAHLPYPLPPLAPLLSPTLYLPLFSPCPQLFSKMVQILTWHVLPTPMFLCKPPILPFSYSPLSSLTPPKLFPKMVQILTRHDLPLHMFLCTLPFSCSPFPLVLTPCPLPYCLKQCKFCNCTHIPLHTSHTLSHLSYLSFLLFMYFLLSCSHPLPPATSPFF